MKTTRRRVVDAAPRKRSAPQMHAIRVRVLFDEDPELSFLDQDEFADRKEAYDRGDFYFVGVRAEADVAIGGIIQTLTSGGLWGIESDSGDDYIREVAGEEWRELRRILTDVGVPTAQLPDKVDPAWIAWRT
jgi:hypothetical protein